MIQTVKTMNENQHIPQGYKNSPLGIIPEDWEVKRLGDVCNNNGDYGLNAPATDYSVNLPTYIRITDIDDNGKFIHSDKKSVNSPDVNAYYLKDGDIVFARTGATVGKTYLYDKNDGELVYAGFLIKFSPNTKAIHPYYLKANTETQNYKNWVMITSQRSGQPGINAAEYCSFKFPVPPLPEQQRIVFVLQLWDTAIEKQTQLVEKLTLRKRGLMQQLLTGKKRLKGFEGEWKEVKLGEIGTRITRKNSEDNKNVVTISAQRGFVIQTDFFSKSIASEVLDNYYLVHRNEFCYNKSYSNGYPMGAIKRLKTFDKAVVTTLYICFKLKDKPETDIDFFEQYCESGLLNKELIKVANEGGRAHGLLNVTPDDFFNMRMRIPNHKEQNAIASVLIQADKGIELANKKLTQLQAQKRGLMQVLLTGKKRVK